MRISHYEVLDRIGSGQSGVVYRALDTRLGRQVALKVLRGPVATQTATARFRQEAAVLAQLDHPNIVPVFDFGEDDGRLFFATKLIEGTDLRAAAGEWRRRPRDLAGVLKKVADAVEHAHRRGVLHRDLKPANILLDAQGEPHLIDFGLARLLEGAETLTTTGVVVGSPGYLSPEQAAGRKDLSPQSDVFALGVILYELLTGELPFGGATPMAVLLAILEADVVPPTRRTKHHVHAGLEAICLKCLEKNPARRYAGASRMGEELDKVVRSMPVRVWRGPSRWRSIAEWAALAALVVVAVFSANWWLSSKTKDAEDQAASYEPTNLRRLLPSMEIARRAYHNKDFARYVRVLGAHLDVVRDLPQVPEWELLVRHYSLVRDTHVSSVYSTKSMLWSQDGRVIRWESPTEVPPPGIARPEEFARLDSLFFPAGDPTNKRVVFYLSPDGKLLLSGPKYMEWGLRFPGADQIGDLPNQEGDRFGHVDRRIFWNVWDVEKLRAATSPLIRD